jgi:hypothetical protein
MRADLSPNRFCQDYCAKIFLCSLPSNNSISRWFTDVGYHPDYSSPWRPTNDACQYDSRLDFLGLGCIRIDIERMARGSRTRQDHRCRPSGSAVHAPA